MKKRAKTNREGMDKFLRVRIPGALKDRLEAIACSRAPAPGQRAVTISDVAREYLMMATDTNGKAKQ